MPQEDSRTISVKILDKEYQVKCLAGEVDALRKSASYLDEQMRAMRSNSSVIGLERIAVMASLNIANEMLKQADETTHVVESNDARLKQLAAKLDQAISRLSAHVDR